MAYERLHVGLEAAHKAAGKPPCKDCKERYPGCHAKCEDKYLAWKAKSRKNRDEYYNAVKGDLDANAVRLDGKMHNLMKMHECGERYDGRGGRFVRSR